MITTRHSSKLPMRRWTAGALSVGAAALLAACGSITGGGSSPGTSSAPAASASASGGSIPCAQISALRTALTNLSHLSVSPSSAGQIAINLASAEQELSALKGQAGGAFSAQANQLSASLDAIKAAAAAAVRDPSPGNLTKLADSVGSFKTTAEPIIKEMQTACPAG